MKANKVCRIELMRALLYPSEPAGEDEETAAHFGVGRQTISDWERVKQPTTNIPGDISCKPDEDDHRSVTDVEETEP